MIFNFGLKHLSIHNELLLPLKYSLLLFAAEDEGRTEEPTEYKLRKAREEGKVAKSVEFTSALVLLCGAVTIGLLSTYLFYNIVDMLRFFFQGAEEINITNDTRIFPLFYYYFLRLAIPIMLVVFIAALMGNLLQVGFLFTVKPITPDFNRIMPRFGRFFKRAFFSQEAIFNLLKSVFKIVVIAVLAFINVSFEFHRIVKLIQMPFLMGFSLIASLAFRIVIEAAVILMIFSIFDYMFQKRQHIESLKMSRQEIKEERKMFEGDPLVKSRLRERMREILSRNIFRTVPEADVVITNPTHYAVAMQWDRNIMPAPTVTAKGIDNLAQKIREIALENNVPVVENKPLARALYDEVEIGDVIPEKFYEVMATILAQVYKMSGKNTAAVS
jgi:flagellar biosynthetic protein FlhB